MEHIHIYATLNRSTQRVTSLKIWSDDDQGWVNDPQSTYFGQNTKREFFECFDTAEHIQATKKWFADEMNTMAEVIVASPK